MRFTFILPLIFGFMMTACQKKPNPFIRSAALQFQCDIDSLNEYREFVVESLPGYEKDQKTFDYFHELSFQIHTKCGTLNQAAYRSCFPEVSTELQTLEDFLQVTDVTKSNLDVINENNQSKKTRKNLYVVESESEIEALKKQLKSQGIKEENIKIVSRQNSIVYADRKIEEKKQEVFGKFPVLAIVVEAIGEKLVENEQEERKLEETILKQLGHGKEEIATLRDWQSTLKAMSNAKTAKAVDTTLDLTPPYILRIMGPLPYLGIASYAEVLETKTNYQSSIVNLATFEAQMDCLKKATPAKVKVSDNGGQGTFTLNSTTPTQETSSLKFRTNLQAVQTHTLKLLNPSHYVVPVEEIKLTLSGALLTEESGLTIQSENCEGQTLQPDQSCTVTVAYNALSAEVKNAIITVTSKDSTYKNIINIEAETIMPRLILTKISGPGTFEGQNLNFGTTGLLATQTVNLQLKNSGTNASLNSITLSSTSNNTEFSVQADSCQNATLGPLGTCQFSITYNAQSVGNQSAFMTIGSALDTIQISLNLLGSATPPALSITLESSDSGVTLNGTNLNFGAVEVQVNKVATLKVKNTAPAASILNLQVNNSNLSDFNIIENSCLGANLAAQASCEIKVRFSGVQIDTQKTGVISITNTSTTAINAINLSATTTAPPISFQLVSSDSGVSFSTNKLDFGSTYINQSRLGTIRITNRAQVATLTNLKTEIIANPANNGLDQFQSVINNCQGANIGPNESCTMQIRYRGSVPSGVTIPHKADLEISTTQMGDLNPKLALEGSSEEVKLSVLNTTGDEFITNITNQTYGTEIRAHFGTWVDGSVLRLPIYLKNNTSVDITGIGPNYESGANSGFFIQMGSRENPDQCNTIRAGQSCTINVYFDTLFTNIGNLSRITDTAIINIRHSLSSQIIKLDLQGEVLKAIQDWGITDYYGLYNFVDNSDDQNVLVDFDLPGDYVDFYVQNLGNTSAQHITVNKSPLDFIVVSNCELIDLLPNEYCRVTVQYSPLKKSSGKKVVKMNLKKQTNFLKDIFDFTTVRGEDFLQRPFPTISIDIFADENFKCAGEKCVKASNAQSHSLAPNIIDAKIKTKVGSRIDEVIRKKK